MGVNDISDALCVLLDLHFVATLHFEHKQTLNNLFDEFIPQLVSQTLGVSQEKLIDIDRARH
jgi:hypothetical protein